MAKNIWKKINSSNIFPIIFLTVIFFSFFYKFFFKGLVPIASDITVGMYYPWINNSYGYPVKVPFKNATLTDTVSQFWIWRNWAIDSLKNGTVAIWNPYSLAGYPMSPWFHTILFQPSNIFYFLFSKTTAMGMIVSLQLFLILISTYLYFSQVTKSKTISLFGSFAFTFSAYNLGWLTWGTVSFSLACLPLILLSLEQKRYLLLSFSTLFCILGGHPQTVFYCGLISLIYYLYKFGFKLNYKLLLFGILGVTMSTFVIFPSLEIINKSIRNQDIFIQNQDYGFISYADVFISTMSQNYFGNPGTQNYWGQNTMQEKLSGVSIIVVLLSLLYFAKYKFSGTKTSKLGLLLLLLGILLSTKYPVGWLIYYFKIPLISTSPASRALILVVIGLVIISVESLLVFSRYKLKEIIKPAVLLTLMLCVLYLPIIYFRYVYQYQNTDIKQLLTVDYINYNISFRNLSLTMATLLISTVLLIILKYKKLLIMLVILVPVIEGFYFGWKYTPFSDPKLYFPTTPALDYVINAQKQSTDYFRVEREKAEILPPNMWQAYGLSSFSGYDPIYPISYNKFLINNNLIGNYSRYFEIDKNNINHFQDMGLKYLFVINRDKQGYPSINGDTPFWTKDNNWTKVFQEKNVSILQNNQYTPPYGLQTKQPNDTVRLISHQDDYWEFEVVATKDNSFYLYENNFVGWKATINDQPVTINNYQQTFKSVPIKSGNNMVKMSYKNGLFWVGGCISIVTMILTILLSYLLQHHPISSLKPKHH